MRVARRAVQLRCARVEEIAGGNMLLIFDDLGLLSLVGGGAQGRGAAYTMVRLGQRQGRARLGEGAGLDCLVL